MLRRLAGISGDVWYDEGGGDALANSIGSGHRPLRHTCSPGGRGRGIGGVSLSLSVSATKGTGAPMLGQHDVLPRIAT
ncbi:hypothetical protein HNQ50_003996 [Silvimonas terrae]|uniref:Uncharacterized protein n=1 Tax=Silvimonas terrae TaxID=300266 RepID=A0A840RM23_9NEIS|nr:hypothetical protein [Silvimonas terrae]